MINYKQVQSQKQSLKINPQQIQFLNFLQLGGNELEDYIDKELEENPFLKEEHKPLEQYTLKVNNSSASTIDWQTNQVEEFCFYDHLKEQLNFLSLSDSQREIATFIIASVDEKGFLSSSIEDLCEHLSFAKNTFYDETEVKGVLKIVQKLEPLGTALPNLTSYLASQLSDNKCCTNLIENHLDDLVNKNYKGIMEGLLINEEELKACLDKIASLKPFPSYGFAVNLQAETNRIYTEYKIEIDGDQIYGSLVKSRERFFKIDKSYGKNINHLNDKKAKSFIQNKLHSAQWFLEAMQQREETMTLVLNEVIKRQKAFFLSRGDWQKLKPMILKDIAQSIDCTISTVSRVSSTKYIDTPFGILSLKKLFSESVITANGKLISTKDIQDKVEQMINKEDKQNPLTDKEIMNTLGEKGIPLTRRTITKYRENLNISPSKLRRTLSI